MQPWRFVTRHLPIPIHLPNCSPVLIFAGPLPVDTSATSKAHTRCVVTRDLHIPYLPTQMLSCLIFSCSLNGQTSTTFIPRCQLACNNPPPSFRQTMLCPSLHHRSRVIFIIMSPPLNAPPLHNFSDNKPHSSECHVHVFAPFTPIPMALHLCRLK